MVADHAVLSTNNTWPLSSYGVQQWEYEYLKANDEYFTKLAPAGQGLLALSAIGIPVAIPPIIILWRNGNLPGIQLGILFLYCSLTNLINALIWKTDDMMTWWGGFGLCDIEVRVQAYMATTVGTTCTCILWSLASALNVNQTGIPTSRQKRNRFIIECILCFVVPATVSLLSLIIQPTRYGIKTIQGCVLMVSPTIPAIFLYHVWGVIFLLPASYYAFLTLYRLYCYHKDFQNLVSTSPHKDRQRFFRLLALALFLLAVCIPAQCCSVARNIRDAIPFQEWDFHQVHDSSLWDIPWYQPAGGVIWFQVWIDGLCPYVLFTFFGWGEEANKLYRGMAASIHLDRLVGWFQRKFSKRDPCMERRTSFAVSKISNDPAGVAGQDKSGLTFAAHSASFLSDVQTHASSDYANYYRNSSKSSKGAADCSGDSLRTYNPRISVSTNLNHSASSSRTRVPAPWDAMPIDLRHAT